ncbi:branched-chain amino acid ABC transporter permease [Fusibacter ferrireducens]|uniref:Branched-chain amino acid ABC transporter permease n=1 Tax=Fusibacter ferrireducens TaxID=2785058 RepID=A0ABR9ZRH5_9FIRM|nr:branched-chain amino acid ABC transporter permease [Fusibacter ferrireducens]MBF4693039.1 branched-chain amino acid ABC transporter permease [Fusibacter ferrireducens]
MTLFFQNIVGGMQSASMYGLAALGLVLIYKTTGVINFAQGELGMFHAFVAAALLAAGVPVGLAVLVTLLIAGAVGFLIEWGIMRHAIKIDALGKMIMTMGLVMVAQGLAPMLFGNNPLYFPKLLGGDPIMILGISILPNTLLIITITLTIMGILFYILQKTRWGLAIRVTAENVNTARLMGIPTQKVSLVIWMMGTVLGALAAIMVAPLTTVNVSMMADIHLKSFISAVLGGFATFYGPVVGAFIIGMLNNIIGFYISSKWATAILYFFILIVLVLKPTGLFGKKFIKKV